MPLPMFWELAQAEKQRAERQNKRLAERTIDAQRASAPVPRCISPMPRMNCSLCHPEDVLLSHPERQRYTKIQSSVTKACCRRRDTVQIYQQLYESGLQYGPAFRLLRNVHVPDMAAV